jgi:hypothetical protein
MIEMPDVRPTSTARLAARRLRWRTRRFHRLSTARKMLAAEAVFWLALSRLMLFVVPFRVLAAWFGVVTAPSAVPGGLFSNSDLDLAREISWAVTTAARHVPFRAVCLPQAIAAKAMLGRRHIANVMHFGVIKKPDEPFAAHAWLNAGPVEVTGYPVAHDFIEMVQFV